MSALDEIRFRASLECEDERDYLNAEADRDRLLDALDAVLALAGHWESRGEHDMAFSKTIRDEDIAVAILTDGALKVENARHIRNAVNDALDKP